MQTQLRQFPTLHMVATPKPTGRFKPYSLSALAAFPAPSWLVEDVLPAKGLATIYGRPSDGKTFVALDLALCVATGMPWHGHKTKQRQVVYVASEGAGGIQTRAAAWEQYHSRQAGQFFVVKEAVQLLTTSEVDEFIQAIQAEPLEPGLVVIDTFARSFSGDENSAQEVGSAIKALERIQKALGCTVVIVHHSGKARSVRTPERGSSALRGAMDVMINVAKLKNVVGISSDKQKEAEDFAKLNLVLHVVSLGVDPAGKARSSCVLTDPARGLTARVRTASEIAALKALATLPAGPVATATWSQASLLRGVNYYCRLATTISAGEGSAKEHRPPPGGTRLLSPAGW